MLAPKRHAHRNVLLFSRERQMPKRDLLPPRFLSVSGARRATSFFVCVSGLLFFVVVSTLVLLPLYPGDVLSSFELREPRAPNRA